MIRRRPRTTQPGDAEPDAAPDADAADDDDVWREPPTPLGASTAETEPDGPWWQQAGSGRPIPVEGGIAAATRRGPIGSTWWSKRFLSALEAVLVGGRIERGRSYARKGQVLDLHIGPGLVESQVQGSREEPYRVRLALPVVDAREWDRIVTALGRHAGYSARMLAGELPPEVEAVFDADGASLLPGAGGRLATECTCPDWENPCKHVAAVCYLLAERFDRDPFELLAWRGRTREDVLAQLRLVRRAQAAPEPEAEAEAEAEGVAAVATSDEVSGDEAAVEPGVLHGDRFWVAGDGLAALRETPVATDAPGAVLRALERGVVDVEGKDLADVVVPLYARLTVEAARRARR